MPSSEVAGTLVSLNTVNLSNNHVGVGGPEYFPEFICSLRNLSSLDLFYNNIKGFPMGETMSAASIKELNVKGNDIQKVIFITQLLIN